mgnify:CR=1 FL=1
MGQLLWLTGRVCLVAGGIGTGFDVGGLPHLVATLIWGLDAVTDIAPLFDLVRLRAGLDDWLAGNAMMKRTFRSIAQIAGLTQRNYPGLRKSGRQATFSTDILYDTLRRYDPGHLMHNILLTGAAGYIGSHIVVELARHLLGADWMEKYIQKASNGGIERVLL